LHDTPERIVSRI